MLFCVSVEIDFGQLGQDFPVIRQKIIEGERPKFEDPTAPAESVVLHFRLFSNLIARQISGPLQVLCEP